MCLGKADTSVTAWSESVDAADLFVSSITIMELELRVRRLNTRTLRKGLCCAPGWRARPAEFSRETLPIDTGVAQSCARLHAPDKLVERDALR